MDDAEGDTIPLALQELKRRLRRRADLNVANALGIQVLLLAGYKRDEITERLKLTRDEYGHAFRWLKEELATARDEP